MNAVETIQQLRNEKNLDYVISDHNPYRLTVNEKNVQTSYLFSTPIRFKSSGILNDCTWHENYGKYQSNGVSFDSKISVNNNTITLQKPRHRYALSGESVQTVCSTGDKLVGKDICITLTSNGVMVSTRSVAGKPVSFSLKTSNPRLNIRCNSQYFAFLENKLSPAVTLSVLYYRTNNKICYPLLLTSEKIDNYTYNITFIPSVSMDGDILFEFNLYEEKLFQDTTVSEKLPDENNAFGSVAYIGHTNTFGEQWLYSKTIFSHMEKYFFDKVQSMTIWIPKLSNDRPNLSAYKMEQRFCSFGSTWNNKTPYENKEISINETEEYLLLDITTSNIIDGWLFPTNGLLLKISDCSNSHLVISTGDSYAYPQIMEIRTNR